MDIIFVGCLVVYFFQVVVCVRKGCLCSGIIKISCSIVAVIYAQFMIRLGSRIAARKGAKSEWTSMGWGWVASDMCNDN